MEKLVLERAAFTEKQPELARIFFLQRIQSIFFKDEDIIVRPAVDGTRTLLFRVAIYELVCEGQKRGQIRVEQSPAKITGMIVACFLHAQGSWLAGDRTSSLVEKVHRWLHALLDGIGCKGYRQLSPCFNGGQLLQMAAQAESQVGLNPQAIIVIPG